MQRQNTIAANNTIETVGNQLEITEREFCLFKDLIYDRTGIFLSDAKHSLVVSRLSKRMRELNLDSFASYFQLVTAKNNLQELQFTIDSLTTNETYFFREESHFDYLKNTILPKVKSNSNYSVWSAASSSGEEAYTTAMVIADSLAISGNWKILGTDINASVITHARRGLYPITEKGKIQQHYLKKYCLKGVRQHDGMLLIDDKLKSHVSFELLNLIGAWNNSIAGFDLVFLRNVMIYFDMDTKRCLINRIVDSLKPGGYLFIGHSETINKLTNRLNVVVPSICQKIK